MEESILQGAKLQGAQLQHAKLERADLFGAKLQGAKLKGSKLIHAHLAYADLTGADLTDAKLINEFSLDQYFNFKSKLLMQAKYNCKICEGLEPTIFPKELDNESKREAHGMIDVSKANKSG